MIVEITDSKRQKVFEQEFEVQQKIADTYALLGQRIRVSYMTGANSSLEYLLRYRNKKPGMVETCVFHEQVTHAGHTTMTTLGKKLRDGCLATESFFLGKRGIGFYAFHFTGCL